MFGFTCNDSINAIEAFYEISESIEIVKDEWGLSYLPSWDFNAIGSLKFGEGYQIKLIESVNEFSFCNYGVIGVLGCKDLPLLIIIQMHISIMGLVSKQLMVVLIIMLKILIIMQMLMMVLV